MGFFEDLGRKVGEFTQEAKESAAEEASYACTDCGHRFYTKQACPECGSEKVIERDVEQTDGTDDADRAGSEEPIDADNRSDSQ